MTTIFFCGDPHGSFDHIVEATLQERPAAVILLGDMDLQRPLDVELASILALTEVWFIQGNHDTDLEGYYDNLFGSSLADRCLHGRVVEVAGVRIAGLGGVFRSKIWNGKKAVHSSPEAYLAVCGKGNRWRGGMPLRHRSSIFPSEVDLLSTSRADILVTHEAPAMHPLGFAPLSDLALLMGVQAAFHGHHHESIHYEDGCWTGVGLREIFRFHLT